MMTSTFYTATGIWAAPERGRLVNWTPKVVEDGASVGLWLDGDLTKWVDERGLLKREVTRSVRKCDSRLRENLNVLEGYAYRANRQQEVKKMKTF